jgi:hypothetical protein
MSKVATEVNWIDQDEATKVLQIGSSTFLKLVKEGKIRKRHFGQRRYWAPDVIKMSQPEPPKPAA